MVLRRAMIGRSIAPKFDRNYYGKKPYQKPLFHDRAFCLLA